MSILSVDLVQVVGANVAELISTLRTVKRNRQTSTSHPYYTKKIREQVTEIKRSISALKAFDESKSQEIEKQLAHIEGLFESAQDSMGTDLSQSIKELDAIEATVNSDLTLAVEGLNRSHAGKSVMRDAQSIRRVAVVHGKDEPLRKSLFDFLRALGLDPIEFDEAIAETGKGTPYNGEAVDALFEMGHAVVVLFSPDELVRLREDLAGDDNEERWQPRPNVLVEAGIALSRNRDKTVVVEVGPVYVPSDLAGRNTVRLTNEAEQRNRLATRLETAGCPVNRKKNDWYKTGDFTVDPKKLEEK